MKKKMKRMDDGGMATTTSAAGTNSPLGMLKPKMIERYNEFKAKFPNYSWSNTMPTTRSGIMSEMRNARENSRYTNRYNRLSSRFPDYKPTLASPVDTREEFKAYKEGLREYRKANPNVKPARPNRTKGDVDRPNRPFPPRPTTRPEGGMTRPSWPGKGGGLNYGDFRKNGRTYRTGGPGPVPTAPTMKGGGLARKGVGMALAKGGLVKANGCAQRGKTKGRIL